MTPIRMQHVWYQLNAETPINPIIHAINEESERSHVITPQDPLPSPHEDIRDLSSSSVLIGGEPAGVFSPQESMRWNSKSHTIGFLTLLPGYSRPNS